MTAFKTSEQCSLELINHTVLVSNISTYDEASINEMMAKRVDAMDFMPCSAARVSFGNEDKTGDDPAADKKLMKYLADHQHMTPFEYQHATFLIECPLFIRSQIHRHRTFSFNEISRRYTDENLEFWIPDKWRKQAASNRQASSDEEVPCMLHVDGTPLVKLTPTVYTEHLVDACVTTYEGLLQSGVCREQARAVLPQSLLTKFYMGGTLRNWAHFLELRRAEGAQQEVQIVANRIADKLRALWPTSCEVLGI